MNTVVFVSDMAILCTFTGVLENISFILSFASVWELSKCYPEEMEEKGEDLYVIDACSAS